MDYAINKKVNKSFQDAIEAVKASLKNEGFGVISEIDLKDKFKEKLGIEFRNYTILGACNPALAHEAIQHESNIGVMLPCNVLVQEIESGKTEVSAVNPLKTMSAVENDKLQTLAAEVSKKLKAAIDSL